VDWKRLVCDWKQVTGRIKEKWAKLFNNNLATIENQNCPLRIGNSGMEMPRLSFTRMPTVGFLGFNF
jgi:hypothetical protein